MVRILLIYACLTGEKTKDGVKTKLLHTQCDRTFWTDEDPEERLGEAVVVQKPGQIEDF